VRGIGFAAADRIAAAFGIARDSLLRIRAGLSHVLSEAMAEGHGGLPRAELIDASVKVLEVEAELVEPAIAEEVAEGTLVEDTLGGQPAVFLGWLFHSERNIAERLSALGAGPPPWSGIEADRALSWVEARTGISLAPSQSAALRQALRAKVLVITGGPGVGKTTLVNSIIKILAAKGVRILLAAPTGRAAKRMTEATGLEPAPAARGRSPYRRLQACRGQPAARRFAGGGRNVDGRRSADVRAAQSRSTRHGAAAGR
jgi:exodeoxyribonuclease V alpha subunit